MAAHLLGLVVGATLLALAKKTSSRLLTSPEVKPDRTVVFRLKVPGANSVRVDLEGQPSLPMALEKDGVWVATSPPLEPNYYGYTFNADSLSFKDPANFLSKPNLLSQSSMVLVPGVPAELWERQEAPAGVVHHHFFRSRIIDSQSEYLVYTPPNYDMRGTKNYPVLYLLHGFSDMACAWTAVGMAHVILDNLIALGRVRPMLVVMPLGYGVPDFAKPGGRNFSDREQARLNVQLFGESLLKEVVPRVHAAYRAKKSHRNRAIAGLSMGGAQSIYIGLKNSGTFAYVGAFSAGRMPTKEEGADLGEVFEVLDLRKLNRDLKLLYITCGTSDRLIGVQREMVKWLADKGVPFESFETPGAHEWPLWRKNFIDLTERLFL